MFVASEPHILKIQLCPSGVDQTCILMVCTKIVCFPRYINHDDIVSFPHHTNVGTHGDRKLSTSHRKSVNRSREVECFPHHTESLLTDHTKSNVFHTTQIIGYHEVECFPYHTDNWFTRSRMFSIPH